jgi:hypothetical protein
MASGIRKIIIAILTILNEGDRKMLVVLFLMTRTIIVKGAGEMFLDSYFNVSDSGKQFQPANTVELLATITTTSLLKCCQGELFLANVEIISFVFCLSVQLQYSMSNTRL